MDRRLLVLPDRLVFVAYSMGCCCVLSDKCIHNKRPLCMVRCSCCCCAGWFIVLDAVLAAAAVIDAMACWRPGSRT